MGAHESNAGLCDALLRAFFLAKCDEFRQNTAHTHSASSDASTECSFLIERLRVRGCEIPTSAAAERHMDAAGGRRDSSV